MCAGQAPTCEYDLSNVGQAGRVGEAHMRTRQWLQHSTSLINSGLQGRKLLKDLQQQHSTHGSKRSSHQLLLQPCERHSLPLLRKACVVGQVDATHDRGFHNAVCWACNTSLCLDSQGRETWSSPHLVAVPSVTQQALLPGGSVAARGGQQPQETALKQAALGKTLAATAFAAASHN